MTAPSAGTSASTLDPVTTDEPAVRRIVVAPHHFEIGGSQINALELAVEIAKRPGFEVILYAPDGELTERARGLGLELHLSRLREEALSPRRIHELSTLAKRRRVDLVHAYEWAPSIDAAIGVAWLRGTPVLSTVLSMDYPYFLPQDVPVVLGTRALTELALSEGRQAYLLEPPVDTSVFRPGVLAEDVVLSARTECGAGPEDVLIVVVGRISALLKLDGLLTLVHAVGRLERDRRICLAVVGDGPERHQVEQVAAVVNQGAGREVVQLIGARSDPLAYYLAADVAVGMGSSALRAMAVGKPLLVQGEGGFWAVADESTFPLFAAQGLYGVGDGVGSVDRCAEQLERLLDASPVERGRLGALGREVVERTYSLECAADRLTTIYEEAIDRPRVGRREGFTRSVRLTAEILKYRTAVRFPQLKAATHRLRGL